MTFIEVAIIVMSPLTSVIYRSGFRYMHTKYGFVSLHNINYSNI